MKRFFISVAIIAGIVGLICLVAIRPNPLANVNPDSVIEPSSETGFIGEKTVGDPEKAKVIIYEYADYGCTHCAEWNRKINKLIDEHSNDLALIFRSYSLGYTNGPAAARAATAAQLQGYFKEYKDLLFDSQTEWFYAADPELTNLLIDYFKKASGDAGDVDKFKEDMKSDSVKTRLKFEQSLGQKINLSGTPTFRIDGTTIDLAKLEQTIEQHLKS